MNVEKGVKMWKKFASHHKHISRTDIEISVAYRERENEEKIDELLPPNKVRAKSLSIRMPCL